jgi:AbrB family looped-hinge helix DNA binding protein
MSTATLTSKGQTTIPKDIRDRLHLKPGDRLEFVLQPDGRVLMIPATVDVRDLKGILPKPKRKLSLDDIDRVIRDTAVERSTKRR